MEVGERSFRSDSGDEFNGFAIFLLEDEAKPCAAGEDKGKQMVGEDMERNYKMRRASSRRWGLFVRFSHSGGPTAYGRTAESSDEAADGVTRFSTAERQTSPLDPHNLASGLFCLIKSLVRCREDRRRTGDMSSVNHLPRLIKLVPLVHFNQ